MHTESSRRALGVALLLLPFVACKKADDSGDTADTSDTASEKTCVDLLGVTDTDLQACLDQLDIDTVIEPDAGGIDTQIHGTSAFDGTGFWVAYNLPDDGGDFDVWMTRLHCDGSTDIAPFEASDSDDNEIDPVLAVSGGHVLVAWTADTQLSPANMVTRYRIFTTGGSSVTVPNDFLGSRNGAVSVGNQMFPTAVGSDGGFVLGGSWGHEDAPGFQVFSVDLGLDGEIVGDAWDADLDTVHSQTVSKSGVDTTCGVHQVWQEDATSGDPAVSLAKRERGPRTSPHRGATRNLLGGDDLWLAWDDNVGSISVRTPDETVHALPLGAGTHHSPALAATSSEAFVLWLTVTTGFYNSVGVAKVDASGAILAQEDLGTTQAIGVYPLDLTVLDDDRVLVVWQDGDNPAFRLKARVLEL